MQKKVNKKSIMAIIIVLIVVEVICIILINSLINKSKETSKTPKLSELEEVKNDYAYQYFNEMVSEFLKYISNENAEAVISILDKDYIAQNNLDKENVLEYLSEHKDISEYKSEEVFTQKIQFIQSYNGEYNYIKGVITKDGETNNIYLLIKQDYTNSTFAINMITEQEFKEMRDSKNITNSVEINIEKNNYNKQDVEIDSL